MTSPVFFSRPTTSGAPPVLSISLSDHNFSGLASSFACTLAHSRPLCRRMFLSKRAFRVASSSACCAGDSCFTFFFVMARYFNVLAMPCKFIRSAPMAPSLLNRYSTGEQRASKMLTHAIRRLAKLRLSGTPPTWKVVMTALVTVSIAETVLLPLLVTMGIDFRGHACYARTHAACRRGHRSRRCRRCY